MLQRMTEAERSAREAEFLEKARVAFRRMFDPEHQPGLRTFTEREDRACEAGDALSQALMETHLREDELAQTARTHPCPDCGRPKPVRNEEPPEREVVTRSGGVHFARPERTCAVYRRALFPPRP